MIRHCIVNTNTNKVVNIIDYETQQTGVPPGFEPEAPHLLCVANNVAGIDWDYINGQFVDNRPTPPSLLGQD
jgi:hypothetical protein